MSNKNIQFLFIQWNKKDFAKNKTKQTEKTLFLFCTFCWKCVCVSKTILIRQICIEGIISTHVLAIVVCRCIYVCRELCLFTWGIWWNYKCNFSSYSNVVVCVFLYCWNANVYVFMYLCVLILMNLWNIMFLQRLSLIWKYN